jgi:hypothetical protein
VLHVAVAAEAFEPAFLAAAGHLGDEDALDLVADFVDGLDAGVFAVLGEEEEAALGEEDGLRGFAFLQGEGRVAEFFFEVGALQPTPVAALGLALVLAVFLGEIFEARAGFQLGEDVVGRGGEGGVGLAVRCG